MCILLVGLTLLALAGSAGAATLSITADQPFYTFGETITLTVIGHDQGATAYSLFGRLLYTNSQIVALSGTPSQTSAGPPWLQGVLNQSPGSVDVFNQIAFPAATASNYPGRSQS